MIVVHVASSAFARAVDARPVTVGRMHEGVGEGVDESVDGAALRPIGRGGLEDFAARLEGLQGDLAALAEGDAVGVAALFEAAVSRFGRQEASRLWLAAFGATDAAET